MERVLQCLVGAEGSFTAAEFYAEGEDKVDAFWSVIGICHSLATGAGPSPFDTLSSSKALTRSLICEINHWLCTLRDLCSTIAGIFGTSIVLMVVWISSPVAACFSSQCGWTRVFCFKYQLLRLRTFNRSGALSLTRFGRLPWTQYCHGTALLFH
mmetsp:Transcript_55621/g.116383  ORF Transcript_55621/g.116383 Transcript_55621/m.116383 type:complete len:155 (+) Transcript_55621:285-749(+)